MDKKKQRILIVDDSEINRSVLADMLGDEYYTMEAADGVEAVEALNRYGTQIDLVLLDIVMPNMDGFGVLNAMNKNHWIEDIPVVMISTERDPALVVRAYEMGISDFINRPFDAMIVRRRVINTIMLYAKQKKLTELVESQIYEKEKSNNLMVSILSHIVEFRNGESGLHVININTITELLLKSLVQKTDKYKLRYTDISLISTASALHDIGKIAIPEEILNKPGRLTKEEFEVMKTHSMTGARMLSDLPFYQNEKMIRMAYEICRWHHERYDGKGYPDGLKGEDIPIAAQVVALADVYDALTSERVYKPAYSHQTAVQMILNGECGAFNPLLLECLMNVSGDLQERLEHEKGGLHHEREIKEITQEILSQKEMTFSKRTLNLLEHERTKYQFLASMTKDIIFEYTSEPPMLTLSESGAKRLGVKEIVLDPYKNRAFQEVIGVENLKRVTKAISESTPENPVTQYDIRIKIDNEYKWVRIITCSIWTAEEPPQYSGLIGKVAELSREQDEYIDIERITSRDSLTGLLNFAHAKLRIKDLLEYYPEKEFALLIFDLDSFKLANNQYGHGFGDNILKYTAERLQQSVRKGDVVARIGGDEFLVLVESRAGVEIAIERIFNALNGEYDGVPISISMGVAKTEDAGRDCDTLIKGASQALGAVKVKNKGSYFFYESTMQGMGPVLSSIEEIQR